MSTAEALLRVAGLVLLLPLAAYVAAGHFGRDRATKLKAARLTAILMMLLSIWFLATNL